MMSDPQDEWTPFRWLRWKLTGDPLNEYEQFCIEGWSDYAEQHGDSGIGLGRAQAWNHYSKLRRKYPLEEKSDAPQ